MFLQTNRTVYPAYKILSKRLLSNEIRQVLSTRFDPLPGTNDNPVQPALVNKNLNAFNLDMFVNNIKIQGDRGLSILDLVTNLRLTKLANTCLESTHFAVVSYLLENANMQELVSVLLDRPQYGIFLNNFTGFAVTCTLHDKKEYIIGLSLALKMVLLDELNSTFVQIFCLKSALETLKDELLNSHSKEDSILGPSKHKIQEKKIRLKFIRNENKDDKYQNMGKAFLKVASQVLEGKEKHNAQILGLVLTENYVELDKTLATKSTEIMVDISAICKELLSRGKQTDLANKIQKLQYKALFGDVIDKLLEETAIKEPTSLAVAQKQLLPTWQKLRAESKLVVENETAQKQRKENIKKLSDEIATKRDLLWFFNHEDKLELDIYKKCVFYPKRWFGKKKKPRVVDEHYVPPMVGRIN